MRILITGTARRLGQAVAAELAPQHTLRLIGEDPLVRLEGAEVVQGSLLDPTMVRQAVRGIDAVVHAGEPAAVTAAAA
ncbi:MAG: NAD-dependent epimerase/dehydratase family protein [Candidatus Latescibacteria bacterium]|nr:NAD-dependent epimerase/dehydratase family protein [Candidatus Latescibacterota bacterium]